MRIQQIVVVLLCLGLETEGSIRAQDEDTSKKAGPGLGGKFTGEILDVDTSAKTIQVKATDGEVRTFVFVDDTFIEGYAEKTAVGLWKKPPGKGSKVAIAWEKNSGGAAQADKVKFYEIVHQSACSSESCDCSKPGKCKPACRCTAKEKH